MRHNRIYLLITPQNISIINGIDSNNRRSASFYLCVMRHFFNRNLFLAFSLCSATLFQAACSSLPQPDESIVVAQQTPNQNKELKPCRTEPIYRAFPDDPKHRNMEISWKRFIA